MEAETHGAWKEIKGEIQKKWGQLTGDELDQAKGNLSKLAGIIEQKYGLLKKDAELELSRIAAAFQKGKDRIGEALEGDTDKTRQTPQ